MANSFGFELYSWFTFVVRLESMPLYFLTLLAFYGALGRLTLRLGLVAALVGTAIGMVAFKSLPFEAAFTVMFAAIIWLCWCAWRTKGIASSAMGPNGTVRPTAICACSGLASECLTVPNAARRLSSRLRNRLSTKFLNYLRALGFRFWPKSSTRKRASSLICSKSSTGKVLPALWLTARLYS